MVCSQIVLHLLAYNFCMKSKYAAAFAENLKEWLKTSDMSANEFSKRVGIPQQTISRYLNVKREISLENLCKIADFLGEDIDYLIGRKMY